MRRAGGGGGQCLYCKYTVQMRKELRGQLSFFRFPLEPERCLLWVRNSSLLEFESLDAELLYKGFRLCGRHFTRDQFESDRRNSLLPNAVPTLFNGTRIQNEAIDHNVLSATTTNASSIVLHDTDALPDPSLALAPVSTVCFVTQRLKPAIPDDLLLANQLQDVSLFSSGYSPSSSPVIQPPKVCVGPCELPSELNRNVIEKNIKMKQFIPCERLTLLRQNPKPINGSNSMCKILPISTTSIKPKSCQSIPPANLHIKKPVIPFIASTLPPEILRLTDSCPLPSDKCPARKQVVLANKRKCLSTVLNEIVEPGVHSAMVNDNNCFANHQNPSTPPKNLTCQERQAVHKKTCGVSVHNPKPAAPHSVLHPTAPTISILQCPGTAVLPPSLQRNLHNHSAAASFMSKSPARHEEASVLASLCNSHLISGPFDLPYVTAKRGLRNLGKSCFMNAALQVLFHSSLFHAAVMKSFQCGPVADCSIPQKDATTVGMALRSTFVSLGRGNMPALEPNLLLLTCLKDINPKLSVYKEDDVMEFIQPLTQKLNFESNSNSFTDLFILEDIITNECSSCGRQDVISCNEHFALNIPIIQVIKVNMKEVITQYYNIEDALKGIFSQPNSELFCETCMCLQIHFNRRRILTCPDLLCLQLERNHAVYGKIVNPIAVTENIELPSIEGGSVRYRISSVISHAGSNEGGGHFFTHILSADGLTYNFNDSRVSVDACGFRAKTSYVVFYLRDVDNTAPLSHTAAETDKQIPHVSYATPTIPEDKTPKETDKIALSEITLHAAVTDDGETATLHSHQQSGLPRQSPASHSTGRCNEEVTPIHGTKKQETKTKNTKSSPVKQIISFTGAQLACSDAEEMSQDELASPADYLHGNESSTPEAETQARSEQLLNKNNELFEDVEMTSLSPLATTIPSHNENISIKTPILKVTVPEGVSSSLSFAKFELDGEALHNDFDEISSVSEMSSSDSEGDNNKMKRSPMKTKYWKQRPKLLSSCRKVSPNFKPPNSKNVTPAETEREKKPQEPPSRERVRKRLNMGDEEDLELCRKRRKISVKHKPANHVYLPHAGKKISQYNMKEILRRADATRKSDLTPLRRDLYDTVLSMKRALTYYAKLAEKYKGNVEQMRRSKDQLLVERIEECIPKPMCSIIVKQLQYCGETSEASHGHRWSLAEKSDLLALYKVSPAAYRSLQRRLRYMPSPITLQRLLARIIMQPGHNDSTMEHFAHVAKDFTHSQRYSVTVADETSIKEHLSVNVKFGRIDGFVDYGGEEERLALVANQALVIMSRGLFSKWKFLLEYSFARSSTPAEILQKKVSNVITMTRQIGLIPFVVSCDMGANNRKMFKLFGATAEKPYIILDESIVFFCFDACHLIKNIRGGIRSGGLSVDGIPIQFQYLVQSYEYDKNKKNCPRLLSHLTDIHFTCSGGDTMKVVLAVQALSNRMAVTMDNRSDKLGLKEKAEENGEVEPLAFSANVVSKINVMFDTLNASDTPSERNMNRMPVSFSADSHHVKTWKELIEWVKNWNFVDPRGVERPTKRGCIWTMTAAKEIHETLRGQKDLPPFCTRNLSTDCLENTNNLLKQVAGTNRPTVVNFEGAFKSVLLNADRLIPSRHKNCEDDDGVFKTDLQFLITNSGGTPKKKTFVPEGIPYSPSKIDEEAMIHGAHACREVLKKLLTKRLCLCCRNTLASKFVPKVGDYKIYKVLEQHNLPSSKWWPTQAFIYHFMQAKDLFDQLLPSIAHQRHLFMIMENVANRVYKFEAIGCKAHSAELREAFLKQVLLWCARRYCRNRNRELVEDRKKKFQERQEKLNMQADL